MIWIPLALTSGYLLWSLASLANRGEKLNRQLARLQKFQAEFEAKRQTVERLNSRSSLPELGSALLARKKFVDLRSEKRSAKQRRLIKNLKSKERD
jgi:hypothetical protein